MSTEKKNKTREGKDLPRGKAARAGVVGLAAVKVGAGRLSRAAQRAFGKGPEEGEGYEAEARMVFEALSHMRGPALKLAQTLSLEMGWLPEAYRREFQKAHYQVPPLNRAVVRRLVTAEFGKPPEEVFASFEADAFAAASLGQVHRAQSRSGESLAVKVQYPGIREALQSDLAMGRRFLAPLLRSPYVGRVMRELENRFVEEADYRIELQRTQWFHERLEIQGVRVPRPFKELSTERVLTTEFLPGLHLEEWLKTGPSQAVRDRAAQRLWDVFCISFFEWGKIHADPNPGNYLFGEDGTVGLIDFGCVKEHPPAIVEAVARYIQAEVEGDKKTVKEMYARMGLDGNSFDKINPALLESFGRWFAEPFQGESFDFGEHPSYFQGLFGSAKQVPGEKAFSGFTSETVMFDRNLHGLFNIFGQLGARVRMRNRWIEGVK